ncbi:hypothetical protein P7K49_015646 [Saguinus oedipus]|uniref:Uncharacterized protein n=1 Tax=Saguinus oedipus TaxID=9490 RepID=A0ABQ9VCQ2_SAGOE|nr:hypothetical protein P7K49_015646 [Saguinus oedipus]
MGEVASLREAVVQCHGKRPPAVSVPKHHGALMDMRTQVCRRHSWSPFTEENNTDNKLCVPLTLSLS